MISVLDTLAPCHGPACVRDAFSRFPSGIAALAATIDHEPAVMVVSSFAVGVSEDPPLVSFAIQRTSATWPVLAGAAALGVTILGETHADKLRQLADKTSQRRLAGVATTVTPSGALFLDGAPLWLECSIEQIHPAGDHDLVVLRVQAAASDPAVAAVVWHRSSCATLMVGQV